MKTENRLTQPVLRFLFARHSARALHTVAVGR